MRGSSGAFGRDMVFRQRAGETIIAKPAAPRPDNPNDEQIAVRAKFKAASIWARRILSTPEMKAAYRAKTKAGASPYNTAIADFFKAPQIQDINATAYKGVIGDTITIIATDDFKVVAVSVTIYNAAGDIVEQGAALPAVTGGDAWVYTASVANAVPAGGKLLILAADLPGNMTPKEQAL